MDGFLTLDKFNNREVLFLTYLIVINIITFITIIIDKRKARKKNYRISENILIFLSIIGGSLGIILAMTVFRHKTKKKKFYIGVPIIYLLNQIIILIIFNRIK